MCHGYDYRDEREHDRMPVDDSEDEEEPTADFTEPEDVDVDVELLADGGNDEE